MSVWSHVRKDVGRAVRDWRGLTIAIVLPLVILLIYHALNLAAFSKFGRDPDAFILVLSTSFPALLSSCTSLVEEHRLGTFARLARTPARMLEIVGSKAIGAFVILLLQVIVILLAAPFLLGKGTQTVAHDPVALGVLLLLNALAATCLGLTISSVVTTDAQAMQLTAMLLLIMLVLSGFLQPLDQIGRIGAFAEFLPMALGYSGITAYFQYGQLGVVLIFLAVDTIVLILLATIFARLRK